jgi:hypothetical protein
LPAQLQQVQIMHQKRDKSPASAHLVHQQTAADRGLLTLVYDARV